MNEDRNSLTRRDLLLGVSAGAAGAGVPDFAGAKPQPRLEERNKNRTLPRRRLGRTNMNLTVIGAGGEGAGSTEILNRAIDKGVNYIDTAAIYSNGEQVVGEVMKSRRDEVFLTTKWYALAHWSADDCLRSLDKSLNRLQTDHVDLLLLHSVDVDGNPDSPKDGNKRIDNPGLKQAIDIARRQGKAKHFGVSSHNGERKKLLMHAIDTGLFDAILVAFNYATFEQAGIRELLVYAKQHDIGVIGMKAGQGNIDVPNVKPLTAQIAWALSKGVTAVINSNIVRTEQLQDDAIAAAHVNLAQSDFDLLERYTVGTSNEYCRGCAHICEAACPADVRIADILRFDMYHRGYGPGHQDNARLQYAALSPNERLQDQCGTCRKCEEACPYLLPIVEKLRYVDGVSV